MTYHDRTLSTPPSASGPDREKGDQSKKDDLIDLFHRSLEAHDLAVMCHKNVTPEDLYRSGTWQKYEQRASALARSHASNDPFVAFLENEVKGNRSGANSRQSYRSAVVRLAAQDILKLAPALWLQAIGMVKDEDQQKQLARSLKPHVDEETYERIKRAWNSGSPADLTKLSRAMDFIMEVRPDPDHTAIRERQPQRSGEVKRSRSKASKKITLYDLNAHQRRKAKTHPGYDWRSHFWTAAVVPDRYLDNHWRACIAALIVSGCRPSEFCDDLGVTVTAHEAHGDPQLAFQIAGAKCADGDEDGQGKGQEVRFIEISCQTPEALWLFDHVANQERCSVKLVLEAPTHDKKGVRLPPIERRRRVSGCLDKRVGRLGNVAFPRQESRLSPYVFRHAFSSDLRASKDRFGGDEIAAALGHQSERTQGHYGSPNTMRGLNGSRARQIAQISASRPVRSPDRERFHSRTIGKGPDWNS